MAGDPFRSAVEVGLPGSIRTWSGPESAGRISYSAPTTGNNRLNFRVGSTGVPDRASLLVTARICP